MSVCSINYYETPVQNSLIQQRYHQSPVGEGTCSAGHMLNVSIKHLTLGSPFPSCVWDQAIFRKNSALMALILGAYRKGCILDLVTAARSRVQFFLAGL